MSLRDKNTFYHDKFILTIISAEVDQGNKNYCCSLKNQIQNFSQYVFYIKPIMQQKQ